MWMGVWEGGWVWKYFSVSVPIHHYSIFCPPPIFMEIGTSYIYMWVVSIMKGGGYGVECLTPFKPASTGKRGCL